MDATFLPDIRVICANCGLICTHENTILRGVDLAGQFYDAGLLDELIIQIAPVTLGKGMPVFPRRISSPPLRLLSTQVYGVFVEVRYNIGH